MGAHSRHFPALALGALPLSPGNAARPGGSARPGMGGEVTPPRTGRDAAAGAGSAFPFPPRRERGVLRQGAGRGIPLLGSLFPGKIRRRGSLRGRLHVVQWSVKYHTYRQRREQGPGRPRCWYLACSLNILSPKWLWFSLFFSCFIFFFN